jgi:archaeosine-15-forming tRNA-guanine transglycosylase
LFLHLGNNYMLRKEKIIAILDLETAGNTPLAQNLLINILKKGKVQKISEERKEKSLIITEDGSFLSPISSGTLLKRSLNTTDLEEI